MNKRLNPAFWNNCDKATKKDVPTVMNNKTEYKKTIHL